MVLCCVEYARAVCTERAFGATGASFARRYCLRKHRVAEGAREESALRFGIAGAARLSVDNYGNTNKHQLKI